MTMTERPERTQEERAEIRQWVALLNGLGNLDAHLFNLATASERYASVEMTDADRAVLSEATSVVRGLHDATAAEARVEADRLPEIREAIWD